jgi:uncharacterized protein YbjT (DUF2867 family)
MDRARRIAVAGATGRVGRHLVNVLAERGHEVIEIARSRGIDVVTGEGLAEALRDVECVVDVATGASPDQRSATDFFTAAARNLHEAGEQAGVQRIVVVSIIGCDRFSAGYNAAKFAHEQAMLAGPIPVRILRAAQFHELVEQLVDWGTAGDVSYVQEMRTQPVAARTVAEVLADLAIQPASKPKRSPAHRSKSGSARRAEAQNDDPPRCSQVSSARWARQRPGSDRARFTDRA